MNDQYVKNVIEAAMLAAGRPLTMDELVSVFDERDGSILEGHGRLEHLMAGMAAGDAPPRSQTLGRSAASPALSCR